MALYIYTHKLFCPFCETQNCVQDKLPMTLELGEVPAFRCGTCNVRFIVTNPSYLFYAERTRRKKFKREATPKKEKESQSEPEEPS